MLKKTVSGIIITLLLTVVLALISIQQVSASGTVYIRADGSIEPPTAPIQRNGDVYVFTDNNNDSIVIERDNIIIDGDGYTLHGTGAYPSKGIDLSYRNNVTIKNTKIKNFTYGIVLSGFSNYNSISGNNIASNNYGIHIADYSHYNSISGNNITAHNDYGIQVGESSNNSVSGNNITANSGDGIWLFRSSNNSISGNNIASNNYGIHIAISCRHNSISGNNITAHNDYGIRLVDLSHYNSISGNNIIANNNYGIGLYASSNNSIYHNNFIDNTRQVYDTSWDYPMVEPSVNVWDDGCEGNYWSDYIGTDSDGDGIGDAPYIIDENNADRYPLVNLYWNPCDINHDLKVNMIDVGTSARAFGTEPGDERWNCHADITGPIPFEPDNKVNMRDVALIARNFGETYP